MFGDLICRTAYLLLSALVHSGLSAHLLTNRTCTSDMDCEPAHSSCYQKRFCMCDADYVPINRTKFNNFDCERAATKEGDICVHDLQCAVTLGVHAGCVMNERGSPGWGFGACRCLPNFHVVSKLCHPKSYIGDSCRVNDDCYLERKEGDVRAYCDKSVCICPPGRHPSIDRKECVANKGLEGPCEDNDDCKHPNTRCSGIGHCICQEDYEMNYDKTACEARIPKTTLGDSCTTDSQCTTYLKETMCNPLSNTCTCSVGAQRINDTCYQIARLGDRCLERLECVIPSDIGRVDCIGNICSCNPPYKRVVHDCLQGADEQPRRVGNESSRLQMTALTVILCLLLASNGFYEPLTQ